MITTDQSPHRPTGTGRADGETDGIRAGLPYVVDSFELLDHRTRERTIHAADPPAGHYLAVEDGDDLRLLPLARPITHVGRGLVADIRLEDPHVSRRHAIVALRGEGVRVLDDRSSNGTFVNGQRVDVVTLADGDILRVGRAVFRYTRVSATPPSSGRGGRPLRRFPVAPARRRTSGTQTPRRTPVG